MADSLTIRPANPRDLRFVVEVHQEAFPAFFMTILGPRLLYIYYSHVLEHSDSIFLVAEDGQKLVGFVTGTLNPQAFYATMRTRRLAFFRAVALNLIRRPSALPRLLNAYALAGQVGASPITGEAELSSIGVLSASKGRKVGWRLAEAFITTTRLHGLNIRLTTDANGNDQVNHFYRKLGFQLRRTFPKSKGRLMNEYYFCHSEEPGP